MRVNYFFSTWSGSRRQLITWGNLTHQHLQYLAQVKSNLSQITIGWPENSHELKTYESYMRTLNGSKLNGVPIRVVRTENKGLSYGQFSEAIKEYPDFDYYIFNEDDYVPVADNFDSILVNQFKAMDCGWLCGMADITFRDKEEGENHAAISWGISSKEILTEIQSKNGGNLPYGEFRGIDTGGDAQMAFSRGFTDLGYKIQDIRDEFKVPYDGGNGIEIFGDKENPSLIVPIKYAVENNLLGVKPESLFMSEISSFTRHNGKFILTSTMNSMIG